MNWVSSLVFNFVICLITVVVEAFRGIGLNERITILGPGDIRYHFYSYKAIDLMSHMVEQLTLADNLTNVTP